MLINNYCLLHFTLFKNKKKCLAFKDRFFCILNEILYLILEYKKLISCICPERRTPLQVEGDIKAPISHGNRFTDAVPVQVS